MKLRIFVLLTMVLGGLVAGAEPSHVLANEGVTEYVIVLRDEATVAEQTAAQELRVHLEAVTGARFEVVTGEAPGKGLYIGGSEGLGVDQLGADGIRIYSKGDSIHFDGQGARGPLYAVYTFLEDVVGIRWWTPTEAELPHKPKLRVPTQDVAYTPPISVREAFYYHAFDPYFAARNRLNGHSQHVPDSHGGHHRILGWCHTFFPLLPPEDYFEEHPEWYSLIDGKRVDDGQLCLTNEAMRREFTANTLEWVRADPAAGMISISQNDWKDPCECARCSALAEREGSEAGPLINFVNEVAEAVEVEFPDFLVMTLAYQYTRKAPANVRPRDNVVVRLCSIECDFSKPLATGPINADFLRDIEEWSAIAPKLYIWNYVTNFSQFLLPQPNWDGLAEDLRLFVKHNAIGVFEQGDRRSTCGDFQALRPWLMAKLLWNPELDQEELIQEFLTGYYGPAGKYLSEYIEITRDAVSEADIHLKCFRRTTADWLGLEELNRISKLLNKAERAVADNAVYAPRLETARMPIDYVWLRRYNALKREAKERRLAFRGPEDPVAARDAFLRRLTTMDCTEFGEGHPMPGAIPGLSRLFTDATPPPPEYRYLDPDDYIYRSARWPQLTGDAAVAGLVSDPMAADGVAVRIETGVAGRQIRFHVDPEMQGVDDARAHVRLRVDARATEGPACAVGVRDTRKEGNMRREIVRIEDLSPDGYVAVQIPCEGFHLDRYLFVESIEEAEAVDAIYVEGLLVVDRDELRGK